jgi:putative nucleotidyltransferase with HDIG domain
MGHHPAPPLARLDPEPSLSPAGLLLETALVHDREGRTSEAAGALGGSIALARITRDLGILAQALRRLAVIRHLRNEEGAQALCQESYEVALAIGDRKLAAEAENTAAGMAFERGEMRPAREAYQRALELAEGCAELESRIEQNLGILANVRGDLPAALDHYQRSLTRFTAIQDRRGCAIAFHNLGMISADQKLWDEAERYYEESRSIAAETGDVHLQALCLLNHADVHLARGRFEQAREQAEEALRRFDEIGAHLDKADGYKVLGVVYRETGRPGLSEARLRMAMELASASGSILSEAEAARELGRLFQDLKRNQDALQLLNTAHRLFKRLGAQGDLVDVDAKVAELEGTYLAVVRDWGQSIESADTYTYGHCERVATYALAVAGALGLSEDQQTTVRLGAYLHDLGKVRVPHEILNKPGRLAAEETAILQKHPVHGVEMLEGIEFPWDLKPIIRWHHEKADGTGYPDRLMEDQIPVEPQIIGVVDMYDALTSTRSYRAAMPHHEAVEILRASRHWWRAEVFEAFLTTIGAGSGGQVEDHGFQATPMGLSL